MVEYLKGKVRGVLMNDAKNTAEQKTVPMPVPEKVSIPLFQYVGTSEHILVERGDEVTIGQKIADGSHPFAVPIYSSVCGKVTGFQSLVMPTGNRSDTIEITTNGEELMCTELTPPVITDHASLIKAVHDSGMVGLGGAGFPTHVKLNPKNLDQVDTLVINGAECEPFNTSDYRGMIEEIDLFFYSLDLLVKHLEIEQVVIAIEDNKPKAVDTILKAMEERTYAKIAVLPTLYPQGAEKMLIYQTLDRVVPEGKLPADIGVIMLNVVTVIEMGRYFRDGIPLVSKRVTIDGNAIKNPANVRAPIGTSVRELAEFCGGYKNEPRKILMGGPMMGITIYDESYPLLKNNNAILFFDKEQSFRYEETACINCGRCTRACPMYLMPMFLKRANERDDLEALKTYKMELCIECGCCSFACPSRQELVHSHRMAKAKLRKEREEQNAENE